MAGTVIVDKIQLGDGTTSFQVISNTGGLILSANASSTAFAAGSAAAPSITASGDTNTGIFFPGADRIGFAEGGTQVGEFDASGNFLFNSGYGSVATAYGCRAWVNFNGAGTIAIRASGNVSSITDNAISDYTINFTTAMPDANYSVVATIGDSGAETGASAAAACMPKTYATGSVRVLTGYGNSMTPNDWNINNFSIFR
jgi:hypothetical protein